VIFHFLFLFFLEFDIQILYGRPSPTPHTHASPPPSSQSYTIYSTGTSSNSTTGSELPDRGKAGSLLGIVSKKLFPRCDVPGAPYRYDATYELTYPDTTSSTKVAQSLDREAIPPKWDEDRSEFHVHDCRNNMRFVLVPKVRTYYTDPPVQLVLWTIAAPNGTAWLAGSWYFHGIDGRIDSTNMTFISPENVTIAQLLHSKRGTTYVDAWDIRVDHPEVVEPSVFAFIALCTKEIHNIYRIL
jgi:hypothetical protein